MADDEDEGDFGGLYEDGHWLWDDTSESLLFISDLPPKPVETIQVALKVPTGTIEFRDDIDLIEQMRFRKRYQRKLKPGQLDVITVQVFTLNFPFFACRLNTTDVKDLALYTAPLNLLSPMLINILHLSTTERFIRALILYCQYYLQIAEEMSIRMAQLDTKVRTPDCESVELEFSENLCDLRTLVAKEYATMLIGGNDTKKFHHMGPQKKRRSLSNKDARMFETLLRMCIQIVWIALGRRSFNQLELEVNRLFKTEIFNSVEHMLHTGYIAKMSHEERKVLLGRCVRHDKKMNTRSPLGNELFCHRPIDYRMMGIGVIKYHYLTPRLRYMLLAVSGPQEELDGLDIPLGIIGLPRSFFDTTLHTLPTVMDAGSKNKSKSSISSGGSSKVVGASGKLKPSSSSSLAKSVASVKKSGGGQVTYIYGDIMLPSKEVQIQQLPDTFPEAPDIATPCSETQRKRWLVRLYRLLHPPKPKRKSRLTIGPL